MWGILARPAEKSDEPWRRLPQLLPGSEIFGVDADGGNRFDLVYRAGARKAAAAGLGTRPRFLLTPPPRIADDTGVMRNSAKPFDNAGTKKTGRAARQPRLMGFLITTAGTAFFTKGGCHAERADPQ